MAGWRFGGIDFQGDAGAIDLAAGADAFDDFLSGVAALGIADVRVLQACFVRNLFLAEIVAEPGNALFETKCVEGGVTGGTAAVGACGVLQRLPECGCVGTFDEEFTAGNGVSGGRSDW